MIRRDNLPVVVLLLALLTCLPARAKDAPDAAQILRRMGEVYAQCKTYRDSGMVETVYIDEDGKRREVKQPFKTAFVRPDRFRFEYTETEPGGAKNRYIIWAKRADVRSWWDVEPGVKQEESLGLAVAGATGVSAGSAHTIPALLLSSEVAGRTLLNVTHVSRIEDARLGGRDCYRIRGKFADDPITLWIDRASFLVRRIDERSRHDDFSTEETTIYDPVIDAKIPDSLLQFNPPRRN